jgi:hypothetical protein
MKIAGPFIGNKGVSLNQAIFMHSGEPKAHEIFAQDDSEGFRMTAWKCFSAACEAPRFLRPEARYSVRKAFMGEIDAARLAGIMAAKKAQMASAIAATVSAKGSQLETP